MSSKVATANNNLRICAEHIVSAYVKANPIAPRELPNLIACVYAALTRAFEQGSRTRSSAPASGASDKALQTPRRRIDIDGQTGLSALKHQLRADYLLSPEQYRKKWGLADTHPAAEPRILAS